MLKLAIVVVCFSLCGAGFRSKAVAAVCDRVYLFGANGALLEFRNRHSQQTCVGREWFQLPFL